MSRKFNFGLVSLGISGVIFLNYILFVKIQKMELGDFKKNFGLASVRTNSLISEYNVWPKYSLTASKNSLGCVNSSSDNYEIEKFLQNYKNLEESSRAECRKLFDDMNQIYDITQRYSRPINFPYPFEKKLKENLKSDVLFSLLNHQLVIHVFNRLTFEHSVYNPVRSRRPRPVGTENTWTYVDRISKETKSNCDLCNYAKHTSEDELGRHETNFTVRMSNTFKIERWHGMIITKASHHPTNFSMEELCALLEETVIWANEVHSIEPSYCFPEISWDTLYKAGASQIHPHIHVTVSPNQYYGPMEQLRSVAQNYYDKLQENFFTNLVNIYSSLDLGVQYGKAVALCTLAGKGDLEVMLLAENPSTDLYQLLYFTIKAYQELNLPCFSSSMAWPAIGMSEETEKGRIPAIIRIMSRGDCLLKQNDISSLDLFLVNYRDHDPWALARMLKKTVSKYRKSPS